MKKKLLLGAFSLFTVSIFAQVPEDVLKYSVLPTNGTARINAIGGAMGSLGGDISATFINPAGLGFYNTSEIVISPGFSFLRNKSNFRGTGAKEKDSYFNLGTSGIVGGWKGERKWKSHALSFAFTRTANFSNNIFYTGENDFSSHAEQYAAEVAGSAIDIGDVPGARNVSFGSRLAGYNFLIDTTTLSGNISPDVISLAMWGKLKEGGDFLVNQSHRIETSGGITELALGYAANMDDKLYVGGSLGFSIVDYKKQSTLKETDASGNTDNNFNFSELSETFTTKGVGGNVKLGVIAKPADFIRLGFALHSPTFYSLKDSYHGKMVTDLEKYRTTPGAITIESSDLPGESGIDPEYRYELNSPWRFMVSGSYVLREVEDVRKQKGFLTADIEYVTNGSNRFWQASSYRTDNEQTYYKNVTAAIKDYYKGSFNFRVGGELKFTTIMTRLGFAWYGSPYEDKQLKASRMFLSGGLGYRHAGMFIDLTYIHGLNKEVNFPYRLSDKANTFANTKSTGSNVMLTVGFKI
ncbi:MAG: hypothetical protein ACSLE0_13655 [Chitinophagaceae bacterium]